MTGRERFICAMNHQEADMVPVFEIPISRNYLNKVLGYTPDTADAVSLANLAVKQGYDIAWNAIGGIPGFAIPGYKVGDTYVDEWGNTYKKDPGNWPMDGNLAYPLKEAEDWESYTMPDPNKDSRYEEIDKALEITRENGLGMITSVRGPFSAAWYLYGLDTFLLLFYEDPDVVEEVLDAMADYASVCAARLIRMGVDAILLQDDYGSNLGPFMPPAMFEEFIYPRLKKIVEAVHEVGGKIILHSDGMMMPFLPYVLDAGFDGLHPIQRGAGMDLKLMKDEYGDRLFFIGNVDQRDLMPNGTPEEVAAQAKECIQVAAKGGGYVLSSDHSVHDDIPVENIEAILKAGREYGKYPIEF